MENDDFSENFDRVQIAIVRTIRSRQLPNLSSLHAGPSRESSRSRRGTRGRAGRSAPERVSSRRPRAFFAARAEPGHITLSYRLVLGCINTKFCNQSIILQHFARSTKWSSWILRKFAKFWKNSILQISEKNKQNLQNPEISQKFLQISENFCKILLKFQDFANFCWCFRKFARFCKFP